MTEVSNLIDSLSHLGDTVGTVSERFAQLLADLTLPDSGLRQLSSGLTNAGRLSSYSASIFSSHFSNEPANNIAAAMIAEKAGKSSPTKNIAGEEIKELTDGGKSVAKIAKGGAGILEAMEGLSPAMDKMKKGIGMFGGLMDAFSGIESLQNATAVTSELAAAAEIMGGAEAIAVASTAVGPIGWVVGLGALAVGGLAVYSSGESEPVKEIAQSTFYDDAVSNGNGYLTDIANKQRTADSYITTAEQPKDKTHGQIVREAELLKKKFSADGVIEFDHERANAKDPTYLMAVAGAMRENDLSKNRQIDLRFSDETDANIFGKRFDPFEHYSVSQYVDLAHQRQPAQYNPVQPLFTSIKDNTLRLAVQQYLTDAKTGYQYAEKEYRNKLEEYKNLPTVTTAIKQVWDRFLTVKKEIDHDKTKVVSTDRGREEHSSGQAGRAVQVNLRSLIENFTINVQNANEAAGSLRQKVEEVLLEILNGANTVM